MLNKTLLLAALAAFGFTLSASADDSAAAKANWDRHCRKCHAADGSGTTPLGKKLKILDYTKAESLAEFCDEQLFAMTKDGIEGTQMPGYADKLSDAEIQALVAYMRAFVK